jgi:hypothetical protein
MTGMPHRDEESVKAERRSRAVWRGNRTRRLNVEKKPFDLLDAEIKEIHRRVDEGELDRNDDRVILQAYALRKDLLLGKLRATEVIRKLEESDVREEFEQLKDDLGLS